ncbi:YbhB/YbcL family Raf kinase inhibitor-like protein [Streptosporangium sp. NPDC002544]|uniref:YbhB/YbcL family Raf kinase inhibitor-like protein n=1 Tax=unclassified Streptosporangium TaxID=2632669 RepID=UPI00332ACBFA
MKINIGALRLTSPDFEADGRLPDYATANGEGVSPPLSWSDAPAETRSFALVATDPDAPLIDGFDHWAVYDIPADVKELPKGGDPETGVQGVNGLGKNGWCPASPPPGHGQHRYYFHLFALDTVLGLKPGLTRAQVLAAIDPHVLVQARLVGTYER